VRGLLRRRIVVVIAAITVVATITDAPIGWTSDYWSEHGFASGILSGLLLLTLTVFGVDTYLQHRSARQWRRVAEVAFRSLGHISNAVREVLLEFERGTPTSEKWVDLSRFTSLDAVRRANERVKDSEVGETEISTERVRRLLRDDPWCSAVLVGLEALKQRHREAFGHWAPVLLSTDELAQVLDAQAGLNDSLFNLASAFYDRNRQTDAPFEDVAPLLWEDVLVESVILHEQLLRDTGVEGWRRDRDRLTEEGRARVERVAEGSKPPPWRSPVGGRRVDI
jgi:hypothetical protein